MHSLCTTRTLHEGIGKSTRIIIIIPLGVNEMVEWSNSFVLVPKNNGMVWLCLNPARLNQSLISPVHRGPSINDILPKLIHVQSLALIDGSSGYHITSN